MPLGTLPKSPSYSRSSYNRLPILGRFIPHYEHIQRLHVIYSIAQALTLYKWHHLTGCVQA